MRGGTRTNVSGLRAPETVVRRGDIEDLMTDDQRLSPGQRC